MFMNNRLFLDSSILIEWAKKTQVELLNNLITTTQYTLCISQIVLSEFTYYWLAIQAGKAPVTLKRDGNISQSITMNNPVSLLSKLTYLEPGAAIIPLYLHFMEQYNLLPNDALILAICKLSGITQIASYDADFAPVCRREGIRLIQQLTDLS